MAKEETKDFNAMLHRDTDMPKIQIITDPAVIQKYGGEKMYFAPPLVYDEIMRSVPRGKLLTVGHIRAHLARKNGADFTDPITAGIFVSMAAWASHQRQENKTPYWRTLKAGGELNANYQRRAPALRAVSPVRRTPMPRLRAACTARTACWCATSVFRAHRVRRP